MRKFTNLVVDQDRVDGLAIIGMILASRLDPLC